MDMLGRCKKQVDQSLITQEQSFLVRCLIEGGIEMHQSNWSVRTIRSLSKKQRKIAEQATEIIAKKYDCGILRSREDLDGHTLHKVVDSQDNQILIAKKNEVALFLVVEPSDVQRSIDLALSRQILPPHLLKFLRPSLWDELLKEATSQLSDGTPILVNPNQSILGLSRQIIDEMKRLGASDLHLTPCSHYFRLSLRIDGLIQTISLLEKRVGYELTNHWKVLANLDLTMKNFPQDGSILKLLGDAESSFRINTCPTLFGEKSVLRYHPTSVKTIPMDELGMLDSQQAMYQAAISERSGLILVSGPTGSGKTHTLYAAMHYLSNKNSHIVSIEDPIEACIPHVTQITVNENFQFSDALRSILRQDPNIIFIGEIRDAVTAEIALSASQTGHLVLASVHAPSISGVFHRMEQLGVNLKQLINELRLITSQRLIRLTPKNNALSDKNPRTGYRQGVFEMMELNMQNRIALLRSSHTEKFDFTCDSAIQIRFKDQLSKLLHESSTQRCEWNEVGRVFGYQLVSQLANDSFVESSQCI